MKGLSFLIDRETIDRLLDNLPDSTLVDALERRGIHVIMFGDDEICDALGVSYMTSDECRKYADALGDHFDETFRAEVRDIQV